MIVMTWKTDLCHTSDINSSMYMSILHANLNSHVLYGPTEGVCDGPIMNGLLAQAKISELDVSYTESGNDMRGRICRSSTHHSLPG